MADRQITYGTGIDLSGFGAGLSRMKSMGKVAGGSIGKSLDVKAAFDEKGYQAFLRKMRRDRKELERIASPQIKPTFDEKGYQAFLRKMRKDRQAFDNQAVKSSVRAAQKGTGAGGGIAAPFKVAAIGATRDARGRFLPGARKATAGESGTGGGFGVPKFSMPKFGGLPSMGGLGGGGMIGTALGGLGAGLGAVNVVKTAADLETKIVGLAKAVDLSGDGLEKMKEGLFGLSTSMVGISTDALLDIATTGAKLGVESKDLLEYSAGIAKVSSAIDDMPAGEIAEQIGKLNLVFGLGVHGALQFGSAIDKIADSGASSASGILNVSQRISGVAKISGLSAQETVALSGALLDTGTQAELAAGSLTDLLGSLVDVEAQKNYAEAIGVSAEEFGKTVKDKPIVAIQQFLGALSKLDSAGQNKLLSDVDIKGLTHPSEIKKFALIAETLAGHVSKANTEFSTLNQINDSYNKSAATTNALWVQSSNRIQLLKNTIGSALLPSINTGLSQLGGLAEWMGSAFTGALPKISAVAASGQSFAASFVSYLPSLSTVFDGIKSGIDVVVGSFIIVRDWMDKTFGPGSLTAILGIAAGISGVGFAVSGLVSAFTAVAGTMAVVLNPLIMIPLLGAAAGVGIAALSGNFKSLEESITDANFALENAGGIWEWMQTNAGLNDWTNRLLPFMSDPNDGRRFNGRGELIESKDAIQARERLAAPQIARAREQDKAGGLNSVQQAMQRMEEAKAQTAALQANMATSGIASTLVGPPIAGKGGIGPATADLASSFVGPPIAGKGGTSPSAMTETRFAGAAALGSTDAYRTIAAATAGRGVGGSDEIPKKSYETNRKALLEQRRQTKFQERLVRAAEKNELQIANV